MNSHASPPPELGEVEAYLRRGGLALLLDRMGRVMAAWSYDRGALVRVTPPRPPGAAA